MRKKRVAPLDGAGRAAQQNAELIFGEHNLLLDVRQGSGGVGQRGFGAVGLQLGSHAAFQALRENLETVAEGVGSAAGHFQFLVQFQQAQIRGGNITQQTKQDPAAPLFGREELCAGGLVETANPAPQIHFPEGVQRARNGAPGRAPVGNPIAEQFVAAAADGAVVIDARDELRPGLHGDGPRLFDARDGNAQVVIICQCFADEGLQGCILVNVPPGKVGERVCGGGWFAAEGGRRVHSRTPVVRADSAAWDKHQGNSKFQNPNSKQIPNSKFQTARVQGARESWRLESGASLELGAWSLELSHRGYSWFGDLSGAALAAEPNGLTGTSLFLRVASFSTR